MDNMDNKDFVDDLIRSKMNINDEDENLL